MSNATHIPSPTTAIAALVLGSIAVVGSFVWPIAFILAVIAIILGVRFLVREKSDQSNRKRAKAGVILGAIAILLTIVWVIVTFVALPAATVGTRDKARINDLGKIEEQIEAYRQQHQRQLPTVENLSTNNLVNVKEITDNGEPSNSTVVYSLNTSCRGTTLKNGYALRIVLEETGETYCRGY
jgi:hypothetical protein